MTTTKKDPPTQQGDGSDEGQSTLESVDGRTYWADSVATRGGRPVVGRPSVSSQIPNGETTVSGILRTMIIELIYKTNEFPLGVNLREVSRGVSRRTLHVVYGDFSLQETCAVKIM